MKIDKNHKFLTNFEKIPEKWWNFANFVEIAENLEILPTSWKKDKNPENLPTSFRPKIIKFNQRHEILPILWKLPKIMKYY